MEEETKVCKYCQTKIPKKAKICPNCRKKQGGKLKWIIVAVIVVMVIAVMSSGGDNSASTDSSTTDNKQNAEATTDSTNTADTTDTSATGYTAYDLYKLIADNMSETDDFYYSLDDTTTAFLKDNDALFPTLDRAEAEEKADDSITFAHLEKNISKYEDKLMHLSELYVGQIFESEISDDEYFTEINAIDGDGYQYWIFYNGSLDDIMKDDVIEVYGLPLSMSSFENTDGGTTLCPIIAGSYIVKIEIQ